MRRSLFSLLVLSGCTHVVWYGRSDDRRHIASVLEHCARQRVRFDGVDGPEVRGVGVDGLVLGRNGHSAYPAQVDDGWVVFHDGVPGRVFEGIGDVVLSSDGAHVAYSAQRQGQWLVVHDAVEGPRFAAILSGSLTLGGRGRLAFAAQEGARVVAVVDGAQSEPWDGLAQLAFSADGAHVRYLARRGSEAFAVVDGVIRGPFEAIAELKVAAHEVLVARRSGWHVIVDGLEGPAFDGIGEVNVDGEVAYTGRQGHAEWVLDGERHLGPWSEVKPHLGRTVTGKLVFAAHREDGWHVVLDGVEGPSWDDVDGPVVAGVTVAYLGHHGGQTHLVVGTQVGPAWDWAGQLTLSTDGARVAHLARAGPVPVLVVDGVERRFDVLVAGTLAFSADGRRVGCITGESSTRKLSITLDDGTRRPVDLEELAAALSRRPPEQLLRAPDVELLRRWVSAELELPSRSK